MNDISPEVEAIYAAESPSELMDISARIASDIGFTSLSMVTQIHRPQLRPVTSVASTVDESFVRRYLARDYVDFDPRVSYASLERVSPRLWTREDYNNERTELLYSEASAVGVRSGLIVPVTGKTQTTMITLNVDVDLSYGTRRRDIEESLGRSTLMALALYDQSRVVKKSPEEAGRKNPLSPKEIECLTWVSRGKTSFEAGVIMSISTSTCNFHINNAMRKLNVSTRTQAVSLAIADGFIKP